MQICFTSIDSHSQEGGGGIASYIQSIAPVLVMQGHQVTVVARGKKQKLWEQDGVRHLSVPFGDLHWYIYKFGPSRWLAAVIRELEWSWRIRQAVRHVGKKSPIDIIEGCEIGLSFLWSLNIPFVARLHGDAYTFMKYSGQKIDLGERINRKLELRALANASALSAPSQFQAHEVETELHNRHRVHVIPNPISTWVFEENRQEYCQSEPFIPLILYTGRIEYRKGTLTLLEAMRHVVDAFPTARLVIAGGRHVSIAQEMIEKLLDQYKIRRNVQLLGHIQWQVLSQWYKQASVFVMPSYYETFGISAVEAMAFGLPVVATTAGGLPEVVIDGETGILTPPKDAKALADALVRLLKDPELRESMGKAGHERAHTEFTSEKVACQTISLYENALTIRLI